VYRQNDTKGTKATMENQPTTPHKRALALEAQAYTEEDAWIEKVKPTDQERELHHDDVFQNSTEVEKFEYIDGSYFGAILSIMSDGTLRIDDRASEKPTLLFPEEFEKICKWYLGFE